MSNLSTILSRIAGQYVGTALQPATESYTLKEPSTGKEIAQVANISVDETLEAARIAHEAFPEWSQKSPYERSQVLYAWADLILEHTNEIAELITREMGKPIGDATGEVAYSAGFIKYYAEEVLRLHGEVMPSRFTNKVPVVTKEPVGPVFAITPWNFPAGMIARKISPALAVGCTVIVKPAEQTPLTAVFLGDLWLQAGGPGGVLQVLPVEKPAAMSDALLADPRIQKIAFTGSTAVGKMLYRKAADTIKRISLELGGHAPIIVFDDADIEHAVQHAANSSYRIAGQTCVCTNRIYVQAGVYDKFIEAFSAAVGNLKVGSPFEADTNVGPMVSRAGIERVEAQVADAVANGAKVVVGGQRYEQLDLTYMPTILTDVTSDMKVMSEETFGPVAPVARFESEDEVIEAANSTTYGLAAYVFTNDIGTANRVSRRLQFGIIGINDAGPGADNTPHGGVKESGMGSEGGKWGLDSYLSVKYVSTLF